jgi:hypothetical protein
MFRVTGNRSSVGINDFLFAGGAVSLDLKFVNVF